MFYLNYFCILVFFLHFNEFTLAFMPTNTVWGHNSVLADSKIYFTGGIIPKFPNNFDFSAPSKEFYYLDVKNSFKVGVGLLPWVDLSSVSQILPTHSWSALSLCGLDNDTLVMFGGYFGLAPVDSGKLVYTYEIKSQLWSNPPTNNQPKRKDSRSVCDMKTGKMYMFSGSSDFEGDNMDILNTRTLEWSTSPSEPPTGRFDYTATLLSNGIIVYIGGVLKQNNVLADMSELHLYNINDDKWSIMNTSGYLPASRGYHSAVLTKDGRIIVYGGYNDHSTLTPVTDDLVVLDTTQTNFTWSKASVSTISPLPRSYHSATLVGDYMIVAFGRNNVNLPSPETNEIFILDTSNKFDYRWVNEFILPGNISTNPSSSDEKTKNQSPTNPSPDEETKNQSPTDPSSTKNQSIINKRLIIGIMVSVVVLVLVVGFIVYLYRKRKQPRPKVLLLPVELTQTQG